MPAELYEEVKARQLSASELLQDAIRAELRRIDLIDATDKYLEELHTEIGEPSEEEMAQAEAFVDRIIRECDIKPRSAR
ncbi:MAG: hypothetical protein OXH23_00340 [bacterium]|nr:hypothetical protein [bacterium]